MDEKTIQNLRLRSDTKLRFAKVHLEELKELEHIGGSDFDKAHQESFLYHLLGAKDAFLFELNAHYNSKLSKEDLSLGKLRDALKAKGKSSPELAELYELENQKDSWLFHAKEIRDHSTHISNVPRSYYVKDQEIERVYLKNPKTDKIIERHFVDEFSDWLEKMKLLLEKLRKSAIENNRDQ